MARRAVDSPAHGTGPWQIRRSWPHIEQPTHAGIRGDNASSYQQYDVPERNRGHNQAQKQQPECRFRNEHEPVRTDVSRSA
jgi:hypothetical protein